MADHASIPAGDSGVLPELRDTETDADVAHHQPVMIKELYKRWQV
jgi:hypothetical protein